MAKLSLREQCIRQIVKGSPRTLHRRDEMDNIRAGKIFGQILSLIRTEMGKQRLTDEYILIEVCANCTREDVWGDEDCKYCQMNMRVAKQAQHEADLKVLE